MQFCASMLLPGAISFIVNCAAEDDAGQATMLPALEEVFRAVAVVFSQTAEEHRSRVLGALLPPISGLLGGGGEKSSLIHAAAVSQILSFASLSPAAFKEAAGLMNQVQRDLMESSIRQAVVNRGNSAMQTLTSKPQIALRSF
ncbi:hypothetical protein FRC08_009084 [Ceratobasidium sp. 394]|nr:hypothetical protein FRC08_009084 [Ceratobasidium sp. 394]